MRIAYFIESLHSGGKERRLVELLTYLKQESHKHDLLVVLVKSGIHYSQFYSLGLPPVIIGHKQEKWHLKRCLRFFRLCLRFKPDIIHTWGNIVTTYALPAAVLLRIPIVNSQITDAPVTIKRPSIFYYMTRLNFLASRLIVANSHAGLSSYNIHGIKGRVIHNGVRLDRFQGFETKTLKVKTRYGIATKYAVVMVASFSDNKDWYKYIEVAKILTRDRDNVTFVAVGGGKNLDQIKQIAMKAKIPRLLFTGRINGVESIVSACDIGVLLTHVTHGEGISNSIIEYMALGKPVIANQTGGTREIVYHNYNGILLDQEGPVEIAKIICNLLDNQEWRKKLGQNAKQTIEDRFSIEKMGIAFEKIYSEVLKRKNV